MEKELLEAIPREKLDPDWLARFEEVLGQVVMEMMRRGNEPKVGGMVGEEEVNPVIERPKPDWRMARSVRYKIAGYGADGEMILMKV